MFETGATGYKTIAYINDKDPMETPHLHWGKTKADLQEALRHHQCDPFTIKDPRQP
jgi:hypothetical protein